MIRPDSFRFAHLDARRNPPGPAPTAGETAPPTVSPAHPCCDGHGEHFDHCPLARRVKDRHGPRYITPLGDRRQRAVPCQTCGDPDTWALDAICDRCSLDQRAATFTHLTPQARQALTR